MDIEPQFSDTLRTAIILEKTHAQIVDNPEVANTEVRELCEDRIRKIGELLTPFEGAVIKLLQFRSEAQRIHKNNLTATNIYNSYAVRRRMYSRELKEYNVQQEKLFWERVSSPENQNKQPEEVGIQFIDLELLHETMTYIHPKTFAIFEDEQIDAEVRILPTQLTLQYLRDAVTGRRETGIQPPAIASAESL